MGEKRTERGNHRVYTVIDCSCRAPVSILLYCSGVFRFCVRPIHFNVPHATVKLARSYLIIVKYVMLFEIT